jgi:hypothetical protein
MIPIQLYLRLRLGQESATSAPSFRLHLVYQGQGH